MVPLCLAVILSLSTQALALGELTADPLIVLEGLTTNLHIRCSLENAPKNSLSSVLLIQLEKMENGHQVPIATLHDGDTPRLDSAAMAGRVTVAGNINHQNYSSSFLSINVPTPTKADTGTYVCVMMTFDSDGLLNPLTDSLGINSTEASSVQDLHNALAQVIQDLAGLKQGGTNVSGTCNCDVTRINRLEQENLQLTRRVQALEGGHHSITIGHPPQESNPSRPVGFVAVGNAGSVSYNEVTYNFNNSYHLQNDVFTAPVSGFYFFQAFDSDPRDPMLAIYVGGREVVHSAKAVHNGPTRAPGETASYSPISVSGLFHVDAGEDVEIKYVANTQSYGASFSGTLVSMDP